MATAAADHDARAARLDTAFAGLGAQDRLRALRAAVEGRIVFTTSFGVEDQAIAHCIVQADLDIALVTLDTGRLFPQTYDVWRETERRLGVRIRACYPVGAALEELVAVQGVDGFYDSVPKRHACCGVRKVEPLARALAGANAWVTGLRASQSQHRTGMGFVSFDGPRSLFKANPLLDWSREAAVDYCARNDVPVNTLHAEGYASIGCAPCTRALLPGQEERAGRWWWEQGDKECGLHVGADGALVRALKAEGLADT